MPSLASDILFAVVWLVAIAACWDAVRRHTKSQAAKVVDRRITALEERALELRAGERLERLEQGVRTIQNTQNAPKRREWNT